MENKTSQAVELVEKFYRYASALAQSGQELTPADKRNNAKQCAIICVDEMINHIEKRAKQFHDVTDISDLTRLQQVRNEIQSL